ncbi:MAG: hypothetical protein GTO24_21255 [candidate division Zixibacteria bacterium]|nr:hypothetical protein [candidate division Zixibacteria bacterium]
MRSEIIDMIDYERKLQDQQWGDIDVERTHLEWYPILMKQGGHIADALLIHRFGNSGSPVSARIVHEIVQMLAVGVAWLEFIQDNHAPNITDNYFALADDVIS